MKTTIDLPEELLHRAKVIAAQRRKTLRQLVIEGLQVITGIAPADAASAQPLSADESAYFTLDPETGIPILKGRGVAVTDADVESIRESEAI